MRRLGNILAFIALLLIAILAISGGMGCNPPTIPTIVITNTNTNTNNGGGVAPGPTPSPAPGACVQISAVAIQGPSTMASGASADLDATPQPVRSAACNQASPISWGPLEGQSPVCAVVGPVTTYTPNLRATAPGTCLVTATIRDIASGNAVTGLLQVLVTPS